MNSAKKTLLSCVAGVFGVTSIVAPMSCMTSCGNNGMMADETDRGYSISSNSYESMRRELDNLYYIELKEVPYPEEIIEQKMAEMKQDLAPLDQKAEDLKNAKSEEQIKAQGVDFTALTQALSEQSYKKYKIRLSRSSSAKWSNFISYFNGLKDSSYIYMRNLQMHESQIQQRLKSAQEKFDALFEKLQNEYFYDPLLGITKGMPGLISCFEQCNLEIALVSAIQRLSDFVNRYTFEMKIDDPSVRYDKLTSVFKEPTDISDDWMNKIFKCINRETKEPIPFHGDGELALLPGFVLTPRFAEFTENNYNNTFGMKIDWRIYPASYRNTEYQDLVTAHLYGNNQDIIEGKVKEDEDFAFNKAMQKSDIVLTEYALYPSASYEASKLMDAYFNTHSKEYISFQWDKNAESPQNKYECFYDGIQPNKSKGILNADSLADSGLMISCDNKNYQKLRDVIDEIKAEQEDDEEDRPDSQLTLTEKFVKYVIFKSNVSIDDPDRHLVSHIFQYQYTASINGDDAIAKETKARRSDGFLISESFFDKANNVFADVADVVLRDYLRNRFREVLVQCHILESDFIANTAMTAVQIAKNVVKMIFAGFATMIICALVISMLSVNVAFLGLAWTLYDVFLIDPIEDFCEKIEIIKKSPTLYPMQLKLDSDAEYWFCMRDDSGNFNLDEYQTKKRYFVTADFNDVRPKFQYYTTFPFQTDAKEFYDLCLKNECDPYSFYKQYDDWLYTGKCYLINYGYSGARWVINSVVMAWEEWTWTSLAIETTCEFILSTMISKFCQKEIFKIDPYRTVPQ